MRLLRVDSQEELRLSEDLNDNIPPYAVLSHTWGEDGDEVTFDDLKHDLYRDKAGYAKIRFCAQQAKKDKIEYFWVDTCCIHKSNNTEYSEAINSMFRWYHHAVKCYVYLSDVSTHGVGEEGTTRGWEAAFRQSRWFTRGWTLQELLAPSSVEFYSQEGDFLGQKNTLEQQICNITGLPVSVLRGAPLSDFSVEERMRWVSRRNTKKKEDKAYCLLGIFGVFMPLLYGEEDYAFVRLQKEIAQKQKEDENTDRSYRHARFREPNAKEIVEAASQKFRDSLSQTDVLAFRDFESSQAMLENMRNYCQESFPDASKLTALCVRLFKTTSSLEPLFGLARLIFASLYNEAGFARGALRMVFLKCSGYPVFLEKVITMLDKLVRRLPACSELTGTIHNSNKQLIDAGANPVLYSLTRLPVLLSCIYADILQFCQSVCMIFPANNDKARHQSTRDSSWTPFDARFGNILDQLSEIDEMFALELQLVRQTVQEHHYRTMGSSGDDQRKVAQAVEGDIQELRMRIERSEARLATQFNQFKNALVQSATSTPLTKTTRQQEEEWRLHRIRDFKLWSNPPEHLKEFERARSFRHPKTDAWITRTKEYMKWYQSNLLGRPLEIDPKLPSSSSFGERVLSLQAKPGYGKTVLSSFIIEDLEFALASELDLEPMQPTVAFFHFTAGQRNATDPSQAFRAVLSQLVHQNLEKRDIIDVLCFLMHDAGTGQLNASDYEVEQALGLLFRLLPGCHLVFDGIDECSRPAEFLDHLYGQCSESYSKIVLLHRPDLPLPETWASCQKLLMDMTLNSSDIRQFISTEISRCSTPFKITAGISESEFVDLLAQRANGMFLWAKLMLQYLKCPALTQSERLDCIKQDNLVEGIEKLYGRILQQVETKYRKEKDIIFAMLGVVAVALRPLTLSEIKHALAIRPGHVTSARNQIADFESSWVFFCGSLLELRTDGTMGFIHLSVREFLESAATTGRECHVDRASCHAKLSSTCLSYFLFDMPASMLSGQPGRKALRSNLSQAFPFLEYSLSWVDHGERYLRQLDSSPHQPTSSNAFDTLISIIDVLTSRRLGATVWIEASWTYGTPPLLNRLWEAFGRLTPWFPCTNAMAIRIVERLGKFARDLDVLAEEWSHVLRHYPHEIWGGSITAFAKSSFWFETEETQVNRFSVHKFSSEEGLTEMVEDSQIVIASQVSEDSRYIGLISLKPPGNYVDFVRLHAPKFMSSSDPVTASLKQSFFSASTKRFSRGWKARYKVWKLQEKSVLFDIEINLPPDQIHNILDLSLASQCPWRFSFPAAFSPTLERVIILHTVSQISASVLGSSSSLIFGFHTQILQTHDRQTLGPKDSRSYTTFEPFFSADGRFVASIGSRIYPGQDTTSVIRPRTLTAWRDVSAESKKQNFVYVGQQLVNNAAARNSTGFRNCVAFHPYLPFLAFPQWDRTCLWYLQGTGQPDVVANHSLQFLKFMSDCHLLGLAQITGYDGDGNARKAETVLHDESVQVDIWHVVTKHLSEAEITKFRHARDRETAPRDLSPLSQNPHSNTVTLTELRNTQVFYADRNGSCQTYLPFQGTSSATSLTVLPATEEKTRMVWNKDFQESYSILDRPERHFPSMIERRKRDSSEREEHEQGGSSPKTNPGDLPLIKRTRRFATDGDSS